MASTLGEKLREAREAKDITITEISEQTRISPLYLDSIENDDYSPLPGGIFNKGFIKSFAKYVGVDENEALQDYSRLIASQGSLAEEEPQTYRPEVLTDENNSSSMLTTIFFAVLILGAIVGGALALVNYINTTPAENANVAPTPAENTNLSNANSAETNTNQAIPATDEIKVEFSPMNVNISVSAAVDGQKESSTVKPDETKTYTGQQSVGLSYYKTFIGKIRLTVNGKQITPPNEPRNNRSVVDFEINKDNIAKILQEGKITYGESAGSNTQ